MPQTMPNRRDAVTRFRAMLSEEGIRPALEFLNGISVHRFTAVFMFDGGTLRNLHLIDREDRSVERCPDLPVLDSYCLYVRDTARQFMTEHALKDARVDGHPKQKVVQSYCGYPLQDMRGELIGTICHFDYAPVPFDEQEVYLLEQVGPLLAEAISEMEQSPSVNRSA
ncbi:MAG: GAF domain-containing protein [bacterium]